MAAEVDNLKLMIDAGYKNVDWLNTYWNFYVVFSGAVVGWTFGARGSWSGLQKVLVIAGILIFATFSFDALVKTYRTLNVVVAGLRDQWPAPSAFQGAIISRLSHPLWRLGLCAHALVDVGLCACVQMLPGRTPVDRTARQASG